MMVKFRSDRQRKAVMSKVKKGGVHNVCFVSERKAEVFAGHMRRNGRRCSVHPHPVKRHRDKGYHVIRHHKKK